MTNANSRRPSKKTPEIMICDFTCLANYYLRQWNEVNIGRDYEIGRSVRRSVCPSVCVHDAVCRNGGVLL